MRICQNCGKEIKKKAAVCDQCGTAISDKPTFGRKENQPKKRRGKVKTAAVIAALAIFIMLAVVIFSFLTSPVQQFIGYHQKLILTELILGPGKILDILGNNAFSTDLTITAATDNGGFAWLLKNSSIGLGLNRNKGHLTADADLTLRGSHLVQGTATYEKGKIGLLLPEMDNTYYVMDLGKIIGNLLGTELVFSFSGLLPDVSGKQWRSLIETYLDIVYTAVNKNNLTVEKHADVILPGVDDRFAGTVYTVTPTARDVEDVIVKVASRVEKDEELRSLLWNAKNIQALLSVINGYLPESIDINEELDKRLVLFAQKMQSNAALYGQEFEELGFTWILSVEGGEIRQIRIGMMNRSASDEFADGDRRDYLVFEARGQEKDERTKVLYQTSYVRGGDVENILRHTYTQEGKKESGIYFSPYFGNNSPITVEYSIDRSRESALGFPYGQYRIYNQALGEVAFMEVSAGESGSADHHLLFTNGASSVLEVDINATDKGTARQPDQYAVDIGGYGADEFGRLLEDIGNMLEKKIRERLGFLSIFGL